MHATTGRPQDTKNVGVGLELSTRVDRAPTRGQAPAPRTEGAEGPNASVNGRVEALAPEESDTKPSTWHRGSPEGVSTTCLVDVRAMWSALPRFEKKSYHGTGDGLGWV